MMYYVANILFVVLSYVLLGIATGFMSLGLGHFKKDYLRSLGHSYAEEHDLITQPRIEEIEANGLFWDRHTVQHFGSYVEFILRRPIRFHQALRSNEPFTPQARRVGTDDGEGMILASYSQGL